MQIHTFYIPRYVNTYPTWYPDTSSRLTTSRRRFNFWEVYQLPWELPAKPNPELWRPLLPEPSQELLQYVRKSSYCLSFCCGLKGHKTKAASCIQGNSVVSPDFFSFSLDPLCVSQQLIAINAAFSYILINFKI